MAELMFTITLITCRCFHPVGLLRDVDTGCMDYTRGFRTSSEVAPLAPWAVVRATLGVISEEIRERVSKETLQYCRINLGQAEPDD